jgi:nicotinate-nucleotide pyrophosphorylase (carboxylating)
VVNLAYLPEKLLEQKLLDFLKEDIEFGDITTENMPDMKVKAHIITKDSGYICGLEFVKILLESVGLKISNIKNDGDQVTPGTIVLKMEGSNKLILSVERTILNLLIRLSGITTQTRKLMNKISESKSEIRIAATRKTTPGFRYFEKYAVKVGGGDTHRWNLSDMILIKENHLAFYSETSYNSLISKLKENSSFSKKIEIEVESITQFKEALAANPDIIMLDNFPPEQIHQAIKIIKNQGNNINPLIEISGGINEKNFEEFIISGVDIISLGALTHTVTPLDISLELQV